MRREQISPKPHIKRNPPTAIDVFELILNIKYIFYSSFLKTESASNTVTFETTAVQQKCHATCECPDTLPAALTRMKCLHAQRDNIFRTALFFCTLCRTYTPFNI